MSRNIQELVGRQVRRWEMERRERIEGIEDAQPETILPWVAISREAGVGGMHVAGLVAEALNCQVFGRELVEYITTDEKTFRLVANLLDEKRAGEINMWVSGLLSGRYLAPGEYLNHLAKAVNVISSHDTVVFLGRGAHLLLPRGSGIAVRLIASRSTRLDLFMKSEEIADQKSADRQLMEIERDREGFFRTHFRHRGDTPEHFDMLLNTDYLGRERAAEIITNYFRMKFPDN